MLGRVAWTTSYNDLSSVGLVVEAVPEVMDLKRRVFTALDDVCAPGTILATNTSSLSVTAIAATTKRPQDVVGMHFFNPASVMKLVEVIGTVSTDPAKLATAHDLAAEVGKAPVTITDRAGFIANTLLIGYLNDAISLLDQGLASRDAIDDAMRLGAGLPMGPFTLADLIGLDVTLEVVEVLFAETRDPIHAPAPSLKRLVAAGHLGRKTGRGFYPYDKVGSGTVVPDATSETSSDAATFNGSVGVVGAGVLSGLVAEAVRAGGIEVQTASSAAEVAGLSGCSFIVEASEEDLAAKQAVVAALEGVLSDDAVIAVAAPRVGIAEMAATAKRPEGIIGWHLLEPTKAGRAVEVVGSVVSSASAIGRGQALARALDATPVQCEDRAGLIVARLLFPFLNEAARMLESGYASADDIDTAMTLGCGYPMGPITMLDLLGIDTAVAMLETIHRETGLARHTPVSLLRSLAAVGRLGSRAGGGIRESASR